MPNKIRSVIVDDEELARKALAHELSPHEDIEIAAEFVNGFELIKEISSVKPDLIFLDIQMPKLTGFDVVELLGEDSPLIIFVSAYDEYALQAFETHALDYLMKPVTAARLSQALDRAREKLIQNIPQPMNSLIDSRNSRSSPLSRILIRNGLEVIIIPAEQVAYIEAADDNVKIYTSETLYIKHERMSRLEEMLDPAVFCRIHKSYILNINYLSKIEPYSKDDRLAVLKNKKTIPISRDGYRQLMKMF